MQTNKEILTSIYGEKCMLCKTETKDLQVHHIVPKYEYKRRCELPDNTISNLSLLCKSCHKRIHKFDCRTNEYILMTISILESKVEF